MKVRKPSPFVIMLVVFFLAVPGLACNPLAVATMPPAGGTLPPPARDLEPGASGKIAYQIERDGFDDIFVMNADGSEPVNLTNTPNETEQGPSWSPDGTRIAFICYSNRYGGICVINVDGSGFTQLSKLGTFDKPQWFLDGQRIVFHHYENLYEMNSDGTEQVKLALFDSEYENFQPVWSPDEALIVGSDWFENGDHGPIYLINADGSGTAELAREGSDPAWSPDGKYIAFTGHRDGNVDVYRMNADGSAQIRLTTNGAYDGYPTWSPDGKWIAFVSDRDGNSEIYVMNADGTGQSRLTNSPEVEYSPNWQPYHKIRGGLTLRCTGRGCAAINWPT